MLFNFFLVFIVFDETFWSFESLFPCLLHANFSGCFQNFLCYLVFTSLTLMCLGVCRYVCVHIFVCVYVYVVWGLVIFLNLFTCAIHYNWKVCHFSSSVIHCLWDSSNILDLLMLSHRFLRLFSFFPP